MSNVLADRQSNRNHLTDSTEKSPRFTDFGWLVNPWFDLLFIANVAWPLLLFVNTGDDLAVNGGVLFWQLYFVTTPHRWITLLLVFGDSDRLRSHGKLFGAIALAVVILCLGVRLSTGALTCLLAVDYLWNAWHFAAQHHGVSRIYQRRSQGNRTRCSPREKWIFRSFLLYVIFRVAGVAWSMPTVEPSLAIIDWLVALVPVYLLIRTFSRHVNLRQKRIGAGCLVYQLSLYGLYLSLLGAAHYQKPALLLTLTTASALFHAIEYLAIVSWSVSRRGKDRTGNRELLTKAARNWGIVLGMFIVILGTGGWLMNKHLLELWLTVNLMVAFLHYSYDGIIWKRPRTTSTTAYAT